MSYLPQTFSQDLFQRTRTSNPSSLFSSDFLFSKRPLLWDETTATGGTSTFTVGTSTIDMAVTTSSGSSVVRQTKEYFVYQPDRVHQLSATVVFGTAQANTNQYVGMFDANNGVFWSMQGTVLNVGIRSSVTGTSGTTLVPSASFNIDKLDGTGPSGMIFDPTKVQLLFIEYQWFGVGTVRWGIYYKGTIYYVHVIEHANVGTTVYMLQGNLPVRYEITNVGVAAGSSTMHQICCNVDSEAGYTPQGIKRGIDMGITSVTVGATLLPLLSINLKSTAIRGTIIPSTFSLITTGNVSFRYVVLLNPTLTGAAFTSVDANSIAQYDVTASAVSGGTVINDGYVSNQIKDIIEQPNNSILKLVSNIAGVSDIITVAAQSTAGNTAILAAIEWQEFI